MRASREVAKTTNVCLKLLSAQETMFLYVLLIRFNATISTVTSTAVATLTATTAALAPKQADQVPVTIYCHMMRCNKTVSYILTPNCPYQSGKSK